MVVKHNHGLCVRQSSDRVPDPMHRKRAGTQAGPVLLANAQLADDVPVALFILQVEVLQQS